VLNVINSKPYVGRYRFAFNGKENTNEIFGDGNAVDYGARIYDPRLGRWTATDPRFRQYVPISPYSFGLNNPIFFKDADGNVIVDKDGQVVTVGIKEQPNGTFKAEITFTNSTPEARDEFMKNFSRVATTMIQTPTGREEVQKAIDTKDEIHVTVSIEKNVQLKEKGRDPNNPSEKLYVQEITLGETKVTGVVQNIEGEVLANQIEIIIYEGSIKFVKNSSNIPQAKLWKQNKATADQKIAGVAGHEFYHGLTPAHLASMKDKAKGISDEEHNEAEKKEEAIINESGVNNKK